MRTKTPGPPNACRDSQATAAPSAGCRGAGRRSATARSVRSSMPVWRAMPGTVITVRSLEDSLAHWCTVESRDAFTSCERTWHQ